MASFLSSPSVESWQLHPSVGGCIILLAAVHHVRGCDVSSAVYHLVGGCIVPLAALQLNPKTNNVKIKWALECVGKGDKEYLREKLLKTK